MASVVGIYNLALGRVGVDKTVAAINEASKEARLCTRFYEQCRDEVLEAGAWPFAVKIVALALPSPQGALLPGWGYQYTRPSDALRILAVTDQAGAAAAGTSGSTVYGAWAPDMWVGGEGGSAFRQALSDDGNSQVLLSNVSGAYAVYVARVTNPAVFSALFVSCLADRIAMELALPMTGDPKWLQVAMTRYNTSFMNAADSAYEQVKQSPDGLPPSIAARA